MIHSLSVDPAGDRIATTGGWCLCLWDAKHRAADGSGTGLLGAINFYPQTLHRAQWDPAGSQIAFGGDMGYIGLVRRYEGTGCTTFDDKMTTLQENWLEVARLLGHRSDVVDLAWQSQMTLASASLDNTIIIWNVQTQDRMLKLERHTSFVKAVAWDPLSEFLASISDDRSLIIWGIPQGKMMTIVTKPFEKSPVSSFNGMKIDWSPDGMKLVVVNATKSDQVQLCAVISRRDWSYEYRGIEGHGSTTIAKFNPFKFWKGSKAYHYWVSAGMVGVLSIWSEQIGDTAEDDADKEPVCTAVLGIVISDLCWNPDGYTLLISTLVGEVFEWKLDSKVLGEKEYNDSRSVDLPDRNGVSHDTDNSVMPVGPIKRSDRRKSEAAQRVSLITSPGKRRRLGSLRSSVGASHNASLRDYFQIPVRCRRSSKQKIEVYNHQQTGKSLSFILYQELELKIWSLKLEHHVMHGAANDVFLCIVSAKNQLMVQPFDGSQATLFLAKVFHLKSASLVMPAVQLNGPVEFMDCDEEVTLLLTSADSVISLWDLNQLCQTDSIPIRPDRFPGIDRNMFPVDVRLSQKGNPIVQFSSASFQYCREASDWVETESGTTSTKRAETYQSKPFS